MHPTILAKPGIQMQLCGKDPWKTLSDDLDPQEANMFFENFTPAETMIASTQSDRDIT